MQERFFKRVYSHGDFYKALVLSLRSVRALRLNRQKMLVSPLFKERIMLAVTEVNGCEACSYAHTHIALEEGISPEEIEAILSGDTGHIPEDERTGVFFAQHYTDRRGKVSKASWQTLVHTYGQEGAQVILAMTRMITTGNIYGMAVSALRDRLKGKPSGKTRLIYEVAMIFSVFLYMPPAIIHAVIDTLRKKPLDPF